VLGSNGRPEPNESQQKPLSSHRENVSFQKCGKYCIGSSAKDSRFCPSFPNSVKRKPENTKGAVQ